MPGSLRFVHEAPWEQSGFCPKKQIANIAHSWRMRIVEKVKGIDPIVGREWRKQNSGARTLQNGTNGLSECVPMSAGA